LHDKPLSLGEFGPMVPMLTMFSLDKIHRIKNLRGLVVGRTTFLGRTTLANVLLAKFEELKPQQH